MIIFMSTHIQAKKGEIAETVLLPGDPLRAKHIAETFLTNAVCYNQVRNTFGYTGEYKGHRISVQSTGMGIPSISIYVNELISEYGTKKLFRVGTCGALSTDLKLRDIIMAQGTSTDSSIIHNTFGSSICYAPLADFSLLYKAYEIAKNKNMVVHVSNILSEDRFYNDEIDRQKLLDYGVCAVEMEAAGLYLLAAKYHVQALAVFTVSDSHVTGERASAEERQNSFNDMIEIALETAIQD